MVSTTNDYYNNEEDEFGDSSFLENLDVDAAVSQCGSYRPSTGTTEETQPKPVKRAKLKYPDDNHHNLSETITTKNEHLEECLQQYIFWLFHLSFGSKEKKPSKPSLIMVQMWPIIFWATGSGTSIGYQLPALLPSS